jgi:hypothetical protein
MGFDGASDSSNNIKRWATSSGFETATSGLSTQNLTNSPDCYFHVFSHRLTEMLANPDDLAGSLYRTIDGTSKLVFDLDIA